MTLPPASFWTDEAPHVATNPHDPVAAEGVAELAAREGLKRHCFFQTSGSEGLPKWVALPKEAFLISGTAVNAHFEVTAADRWLIALPLHHVGGFAILARAHLSGSGVVQSTARWQPAAFAELCAREGITLVSLVPAQVHDLVRDRVPCPETLRAAIIGGGGMSQALADAALALGWRVFQSYGMTEAASQVATQPYNPFGPTFDVTSLEVLPHWQAGQDEAGRLTLRGPALATGHALRQPDGGWLWQPISPESGLTTRDVVKLWTHGTRRYLQFVGRESGFVKILGELIHLAPLQTRLETLALGAGWQAMPLLMPAPDARRETRLLLVAQAGEPGVEALRQAFNTATPPLCHVDTADVRLLPSLPRTPVGKPDIQGIKRLLEQTHPAP